jgi:Icc-related predicted phosphoesterase
MTRIVAISDTHLTHEGHNVAVPDGDILIHAGDATFMGRPHEIYRFTKWFAALPHKHKIFISGNHDFLFEREQKRAINLLQGIDAEYFVDASKTNGIIYLQDSEVTVEGLRIWGSPWQPWFYDWAFNLQRGAQIKAKWDLIPDGVDIVVTHGPPAGYGDQVPSGERVGCADLLDALKRIKPKLHICGHIHLGSGTYETDFGTKVLNASICNEAYFPENEAIVVDL